VLIYPISLLLKLSNRNKDIKTDPFIIVLLVKMRIEALYVNKSNIDDYWLICRWPTPIKKF